MTNDGPVDLLYLAYNRLEFTCESFTTLVGTTDWGLVRRLSVYDDGSRDGTEQWLAAALPGIPAPTRLVHSRFGSPIAAMRHWIETSDAPILAKTDNDAMLPPGWLRASLAVLERHPELQLLGIEAMYPHVDDPDLPRSFTPAEFISGLGLYRRAAFARSRPVPADRWFGFEEWQIAQGGRLGRGWITPALPVFLLDRLPFQPWRALSDEYIRRGWQRPWEGYPSSCLLWRWRWPMGVPAEPDKPCGVAITTAALAAPRFVGALRVKNEAPHITEVVERILPLCERVLVFDDHSTDDTAVRCHALGQRVLVIPSPFVGLDEARDKNELLRHVLELDPEWVLWIDGDELLERRGPLQLRQAADRSRAIAAYALQIAYVWDDPEQVRVDGVYGRFARPSFFRVRGQPRERLRFTTTHSGGNLHCGNVPWGLVGAAGTLSVRLKHLGYLTRAQRLAKYAWYSRVDPDNEAEDRYRHLAEIPGARWAGSPPRFVRWTE
jgi:glycosyltransferase involved in cell wall biosynthesis